MKLNKTKIIKKFFLNWMRNKRNRIAKHLKEIYVKPNSKRHF